MRFYVLNSEGEEEAGVIDVTHTADILQVLEDADYIERAADCSLVSAVDGAYYVMQDGDRALVLETPEVWERDTEVDDEPDDDSDTREDEP